MRRFLLISLMAVAGLGLLAGCGGGEDRLSEEEFSTELQEIDQNVSEAFGQVFEAAPNLDRLPQDAEVPEPVKDALPQAAEAERQAADRLEELNPPEEAEDEIDELIEVARAQADNIEQAAEQADLTIGELQQAFEEQDPGAILEQLEEQGFLDGGGEGGGE